MPRSSSMKSEPSRRSRRRAGLAPAVAIDVGLRLSPNDHLSRLPLEILTMILADLDPDDVLKISWTCKAFRKFLFNPTASRATVWKPVLETVEALPPCPPDLNEPQYVTWLYKFGVETCKTCGGNEDIKIFFELRLKLCYLCGRKEFGGLYTLEEEGYNREIVELTPTYVLHKWPEYHRGTVAALAAEYNKQRGPKAKKIWMEEQQRIWNNKKQHGDAYDNALRIQWEKWEIKRKEIKAGRIKRIKEILSELGWEQEIEHYFIKDSANLGDLIPRPFGDEEWAALGPDIIGVMRGIREKLRQKEIGKHIKERITKWLKPAHTAFILSRPPNEINPNILDVALSDEWRTLLCTKPFHEDLTPPMVEAASARILEFAKVWRNDKVKQLLEVVRRSKTYSGQEVTEEVLHLASTIFRCVKCGPIVLRYGLATGDVVTYPHALVHRCNFTLEKPNIQVVSRDVENFQPPPPTESRRYPDSSVPTIRLYREDERHILKALKHVGIWSRFDPVFVFDDDAHKHMVSLLDALGWSRATSAAEMEERQPYVECLCECYNPPGKGPSRKIVRWKKAIYECKAHTKKEPTHGWFSKLNEDDLVKSEQHEEARFKSTHFHCPWCHDYDESIYTTVEPSLLRHVSKCPAIQKPFPPNLKEHIRSINVLTKEESWLHYETEIPLEGQQVERLEGPRGHSDDLCGTCRVMVRNRTWPTVEPDLDPDVEESESESDSSTDEDSD